MPRLIVLLIGVLCLSCSPDTPTAQNPEATQEEIAPWETVSINGVPYRRQAAKAVATQTDLIITIAIPATVAPNGDLIFADTVIIGDRVYTANCNTSSPPPSTGSQPADDDVGNTRATAKPLAVNYPPAGSSDTELTLSPPYKLTTGDVDYFRIQIDRDVEFAAMSWGTTDTVGSLHLSDGTLLERDDNGVLSEFDPNNRNFYLTGEVTNRTYYLKVTGTGLRPTGTYMLAIGIRNRTSAKPVASDHAQRKMGMMEALKP